MNDEHELREAELRKAAGEFPALPAGLRDRVVGAAAAARARQTVRRRALAAVCFLVPTAILSIGLQTDWHGGRAASAGIARQEHRTAHDLDAVLDQAADPLYGARTLLLMPGLGDWDRVDAFVRERRTHLQALQGRF